MKILVYGAFKNAEKSENYKEKVKKYLNNNEKNIKIMWWIKNMETLHINYCRIEL